jgi:hypothetical protein
MTDGGIRGRGQKKQLGLGSKKILYEVPGQILELEVKLAAGASVGNSKMSVKTSWRSRPSPKRKKRLLAA